MYLLDTNVVSELRKKQNANPGVQAFFADLKQTQSKTYLSAITVGELRRGVELIRYRGDHDQAQLLETWLNGVIESYQGSILDFTATEAQVWGKLRVPHYENALDKQIAATALVYDLTLVTRNTADVLSTGVKLLNPFE
ncbi:MAG: type II toxin-antitoxin system VapC family toxin [Hahellaceae bacterium]|nr:type II toxin-antitoxin system VapC family toxin [Hahellaceae bacterium]